MFSDGTMPAPAPRGFAVGGSPAPVQVGRAAASIAVDSAPIAAAVASAISAYQPVVSINGRDFYGVMKETTRSVERS